MKRWEPTYLSHFPSLGAECTEGGGHSFLWPRVDIISAPSHSAYSRWSSLVPCHDVWASEVRMWVPQKMGVQIMRRESRKLTFMLQLTILARLVDVMIHSLAIFWIKMIAIHSVHCLWSYFPTSQPGFSLLSLWNLGPNGKGYGSSK